MKKLIVLLILAILASCWHPGGPGTNGTLKPQLSNYNDDALNIVLKASNINGRFDFYSATPSSNIVNVNGEYYMYYCGAMNSPTSQNSRGREMIGVAISDSIDKPYHSISCSGFADSIFAIGNNGDYDADRNWGNSTVIYENGIWKMWTIGDSDLTIKHVARVGYAESINGIDWTKKGTKADGSIFEDMSYGETEGENTGICLFRVIEKDNKYYALYNYINSTGTPVILAESDNGIDWIKKGTVINQNIEMPSNIMKIDGYYYFVAVSGSVYTEKQTTIVLWKSSDLYTWQNLGTIFAIQNRIILNPILYTENNSVYLFYAIKDSDVDNYSIGGVLFYTDAMGTYSATVDTSAGTISTPKAYAGGAVQGVTQ